MINNQSLLQRSLRSVWHPCTQMKQHETYPLIPLRRGDGVWLYDADGKQYLDAVSSWWVNLFGHNNPRIKDAIKQQLDTLEHVMLAGFTHEPVVALSEKLAQLTGLGHAFYGSDGASATEIALKMSFHYWRNIGKSGKTRFISLQNSYHGETMGSLGVTDVAIFKDTYAPLLVQSAQVPSPDYRLAESGVSAEDFALRCAAQFETYLAEHHAELAAFIIEPLVQCAAGMGMYHPVYLSKVREICTQYEVHLIADEIAVGFGQLRQAIARLATAQRAGHRQGIEDEAGVHVVAHGQDTHVEHGVVPDNSGRAPVVHRQNLRQLIVRVPLDRRAGPYFVDASTVGVEAVVTDVLLRGHLAERVLLGMPEGFEVDTQDCFVWLAHCTTSGVSA